eukprot:322865-Rhodomonas_salina.2
MKLLIIHSSWPLLFQRVLCFPSSAPSALCNNCASLLTATPSTPTLLPPKTPQRSRAGTGPT